MLAQFPVAAVNTDFFENLYIGGEEFYQPGSKAGGVIFQAKLQANSSQATLQAGERVPTQARDVIIRNPIMFVSIIHGNHRIQSTAHEAVD